MTMFMIGVKTVLWCQASNTRHHVLLVMLVLTPVMEFITRGRISVATLLPSGGGNMIQIPFSNMERWTHSGDSVILYDGWICMLDDKL